MIMVALYAHEIDCLNIRFKEDKKVLEQRLQEDLIHSHYMFFMCIVGDLANDYKKLYHGLTDQESWDEAKKEVTMMTFLAADRPFTDKELDEVYGISYLHYDRKDEALCNEEEKSLKV